MKIKEVLTVSLKTQQEQEQSLMEVTMISLQTYTI